jgi:lipopolysaccharide heptosyltransferase II
MTDWSSCKKILCIRADNMGDLLMSGPAIGALKETFQAEITVLTSSNATPVARLIPEIDEVITFDLPWVKLDDYAPSEQLFELVRLLERKKFDACVVFNVYSQNPVPAIMLAYMANIPRRLAWCRENPYLLLTDWVPDPEPYEFIQHQVSRDLVLVGHVGAVTVNEKLSLLLAEESIKELRTKLIGVGIDLEKPYLLLHPGVSEPKRKYPLELWIELAKQISTDPSYNYVLTGSGSEQEEAAIIELATNGKVKSLAGLLSLDQFAALIKSAALVVSVNTGTIHLAAAVQTPVVVLYANSNPQHTPWMVPNIVLEYSIPKELKSKNKVVKYVDELLYSEQQAVPSPDSVVEAVKSLLLSNKASISSNTRS